MSERVNVATQARNFQANGITEGSLAELPIVRTQDSPEAFTALRVLKPELYALTSVLVDRLVRIAYEERATVSRQVNYLSSDNPFPHLGNDMYLHMKGVNERECLALDEGKGSEEITKIYDRINTLTSFFHQAAPIEGTHSGARDFISGGIGTANNTLSGFFGVIPEVASTDKPNELLEIAENSFSIIARLATRKSSTTLAVLDFLEKNPVRFPGFKPGYFIVHKDSKGRKVMTFTQDVEEVIEDDERVDGIMTAFGQVRVGCPGILNLREESAIHLLFQWYKEYATKLYPKLVKSSNANNVIA